MIYFDSAATTFQKPQTVKKAMLSAMNTMSSPSRGESETSARASKLCFDCRELVGEMFACPAENVVFTFNATHALNIAVNSLVNKGDRVVISGFEHNAVTRPLFERGAVVSIAQSNLFDDKALIDQFRRLLPGAKACVCTHASNVFGYVLPIKRISELCNLFSVPLIIDASQSAGCIPLRLDELKADFVAMPGHKGLFGPQGTGLLLCNHEAKPILFGGTGSSSVRQTMPEFLPDRLEAGTHNMPGIAGLYAGLKYVKTKGIERIAEHENSLRVKFADMLSSIPNLEIYEAEKNNQIGVLSVRVRNHDCETFSERLAKRSIAVRSGLHCAPTAHKTVGTFYTGTVRFSFSPFNSEAEVLFVSRIIRDILSKA